MWRNAIPDLHQWAAVPPEAEEDPLPWAGKGYLGETGPVKRQGAERSDRAPTWSWASMDCAVGYNDDLQPDDKLCCEIGLVSVDPTPKYGDRLGLILEGFLMGLGDFELRDDFWLRGGIKWYPDGTLEESSRDLKVLLLLSSRDPTTESYETWDYELGSKMKEIVLLLRQVEEGVFTREGVGIGYWYSKSPDPKSHRAWGRLRVITIK